MKYIIIGLGNYGTVIARELAELGHEVVGADISENVVDAIKDKIAAAFIIDATDEMALSVLPLNNVDVVIVAIGENFGASIRVTAMLKQRGVKHIYARSMDAVHKAILEGFGLDRILSPEEDAAYSLVGQLDFGTEIESFRVDKDHSIIKFTAHEKFVGHTILELNLEQEFNLKLIALTRSGVVTNFLGFSINEQTALSELPTNSNIQAGDELICYGANKDLKGLLKAL